MAAEAGVIVDKFLGKEVDFDGRRVTLQRVIAEGGYAAVYAAVDSSGEKFVVKKVLAGAPEVQRQTALEVEVHSSLSHTHIVKLVAWRAFQMRGGTKAFLSLLEWCPHGDLLARLESASGPISPASVAKVMAAVTAGIAHLHASTTPPAAHRDIKPENVLVGEGGVLKLCDFGSLNQHVGPVTKADRVQVEDDILRFCTPQYRSPELVDTYSGHPVDHRADIWALGCLQYALMFQEHPFDITSSLAILSGKYTLPESHSYPLALTHALDCCLALDPTHPPAPTTIAALYEAVAAGSPTTPSLTTDAGKLAVPQAQETATAAAAASAKARPLPPGRRHKTSTVKIVDTGASSALQQRLAARMGGSAAPVSAPGPAPASYPAPPSDEGEAFDPFASPAAPSPAPSGFSSQQAVEADASDPFGASGGGDEWGVSGGGEWGAEDDPFGAGASAAVGGGEGDDPFGAAPEFTAPHPAHAPAETFDDPFTTPAPAPAPTPAPAPAPAPASAPAAELEHDPFAIAPQATFPPAGHTRHISTASAPATFTVQAADEDLFAGSSLAPATATAPAPGQVFGHASAPGWSGNTHAPQAPVSYPAPYRGMSAQGQYAGHPASYPPQGMYGGAAPGLYGVPSLPPLGGAPHPVQQAPVSAAARISAMMGQPQQQRGYGYPGARRW